MLFDEPFSIEYVEIKEAINSAYKFSYMPLNKAFKLERSFSVNLDKNIIIFEQFPCTYVIFSSI